MGRMQNYFNFIWVNTEFQTTKIHIKPLTKQISKGYSVSDSRCNWAFLAAFDWMKIFKLIFSDIASAVRSLSGSGNFFLRAFNFAISFLV